MKKRYWYYQEVTAYPYEQEPLHTAGLRNAIHFPDFVKGYMVTFQDGRKNWFNENDFFSKFKPLDTPKESIENELHYVSMKMEKLNEYFNSEDFSHLCLYDKELVRLQREHMEAYKNMLLHRLSRSMGGDAGKIDKMFGFGTAIAYLEDGELVSRKAWGEAKYIIKQVPADIDECIIPKMQSLPYSAKNLILGGGKHINYNDQCLIDDAATCEANSWSPTVSDIFAKDWFVYESTTNE